MTEFPAASEAVFKDFYMDDFIKSMNDVQEGLTMQRNMRKLLQKGFVNLTKWCTKEITFCQILSEKILAKLIDELFHHENTGKILGVKWSTFEDSIGIQIHKFDCSEKQSGFSGKLLS